MSVNKRLPALRVLLGWVSPLRTAEAFAELYAQSHRLVYRYIYGLHGGPPEDVDDLAAETYLRAWRHRERFDGDRAAATGWLLHIARNLVVDAHRRRAVRGVPEPLDEAQWAAPGLSPEAAVLLRREYETLVTALSGLPVERREMVVLRYLLGWRVQAIAAHLGIAENTVSVTLRRTLNELRAGWPGAGENER